MQALVVDLDCALGLARLLAAHLLVHTVKEGAFTVSLVLSLDAAFDLHRFLEIIDGLEHFFEVLPDGVDALLV